MKNIKVRDLVILAVLAALTVVLRMLTIYVFGNNRITFYNIPIMLASFAYGPVAGVLVAIIGDVSSIAYQTGWNPFFMIPPLFWGLIPGLLKSVFNYRKFGYLVLIETISHIFVSAANTIVLGLLYGWNVAFGSVNKDSFVFQIEFLNKTFELFTINGFFYFRILMVILLMVIKIPIDSSILNITGKRVMDKVYIPPKKRKLENG